MNPPYDATPWHQVFQSHGQELPAQLIAVLGDEDTAWMRRGSDDYDDGGYEFKMEPLECIEYGVLAEDFPAGHAAKLYWIAGLPELAIYVDLAYNPPHYGTVESGELESSGPDLALWAMLPDWHSKDADAKTLARGLVEAFARLHPLPGPTAALPDVQSV